MIKNISFVEHIFDNNATNLVNEEIKKNIDTPFLIGEIVYVIEHYTDNSNTYESIHKVKITEILVSFSESGVNIMYEVTNGEDSYYVEGKDIIKIKDIIITQKKQ